MHKKALRLAALFAMFLFAAAPSARAQVDVTAGSVSGLAGEEVLIPVSVGDMGGTALTGFQFTLTYDPAVLTITDYSSDGTLSSGMVVATNSPAAGEFRVAAAAAADIGDNGTLINLKATLVAPVSSALDFGGTVLLNSSSTPAANEIDGTATVVGSVGLTLPTSSMYVLKTATLDVTYDDLGSGLVAAYETVFSFDSSIINITQVIPNAAVGFGDGSAGFPSVNIDNTNGVVRVASAAGAGVTAEGPGTLYQLEISSVGVGTSALTWTTTVLNSGAPAVTDVDGSITVLANAVPVADDQDVSVDEDMTLEVTLTGSDVDMDSPLTYAIATAPTNGTHSIADNVVTYVPNADFNGADSFTFTIFDGEDTSAPGTVSITVDPVNDAPVVQVVSATTDEDNAVVITLLGTDVDGDALSYSVVTDVANGGTDIVGDQLTYTPDGDFNGSDAFTYVAFDGTVNSAEADGTITVVAVNDAPVATDGMATIEEGMGGVTVTMDVTDVDGDALTYHVVGDGPANGKVSLMGSELMYMPNPGFVGTDTIQFHGNDGTVDSNIATITVTVTAAPASVRFETELSGVHAMPSGNESPGGGRFWMSLIDTRDQYDYCLETANLSAPPSAAHIHMAAVGETGGVAFPFDLGAAMMAPNGRGFRLCGTGTISSFLATAGADALDKMADGMYYVNVHTPAYPGGEVRGQILAAGNTAPPAVSVRAPASVVIMGNADDRLMSVSWLPVTDPDGDTVNYIFQMALDAGFSDVVIAERFGDGVGFRLTVEDAAMLFDELAGAAPGAIPLGGTATVYHRVISTDGWGWTAGPTRTLTLERQTVTDTEGLELPEVFALKGNYPNPFNPTTSISFDLPETAEVSVKVLDMLGREVMAVPANTVDAGAARTVQLQMGDVPSGLYLYRVEARMAQRAQVLTGTMTLIK